MTEKEVFEGWAILELMGHRKLGGYVRETTLAGAGVLRIDIPAANEGESGITQFYPPSSMYGLTPVSEEVARAVAKHNIPTPVHRWELPPAPAVHPTNEEVTREIREAELDDEGEPIF